MTDEFQKGLITGLAMQPLQVTTEHAEPDPVKEEAVAFIHAFVQIGGMINIFRTVGEIVEST